MSTTRVGAQARKGDAVPRAPVALLQVAQVQPEEPGVGPPVAQAVEGAEADFLDPGSAQPVRRPEAVGQVGLGAAQVVAGVGRGVVGLLVDEDGAQPRRGQGGVVDMLARRNGAEFRDYRKYSGETARINVGGQDIVLLKPTTYMNRSGLSVRQLSDFYKVAAGRHPGGT